MADQLHSPHDLDDHGKTANVQQQQTKSFRLIKKLDAGAFCEIYQGLNLENHQDVAVKLEQASSKTPMLMYEAKLYQYLHKEKELHGAEALWAERIPKPEKGIPQVYYCSNEGDYNVLVMELLGPNLEDLFNICDRKFSVKTVFCIAIQALERLEFLHSKNFVHRDVKPHNFCIGTGAKRGTIYMIDLAFAKCFQTRHGKHIPFSSDKAGITGTVRFASVNNHRGIEHTRRDDLESLAYMLIYFLKGQLPWQNLKYVSNSKKEKLEKVYDKKQYLTPEAMCKGLPDEIAIFLRSVRELQFEEKPNYQVYKQSFEEGLKKRGLTKDQVYDWNLAAQRIDTVQVQQTTNAANTARTESQN